jgi:hypothetical protein
MSFGDERNFYYWTNMDSEYFYFLNYNYLKKKVHHGEKTTFSCKNSAELWNF